MPYQFNSDLPLSVMAHLPGGAQDIYRAAFNNAFESYSGDPISAATRRNGLVHSHRRMTGRRNGSFYGCGANLRSQRNEALGNFTRIMRRELHPKFRALFCL
jgi:ChaB